MEVRVDSTPTRDLCHGNCAFEEPAEERHDEVRQQSDDGSRLTIPDRRRRELGNELSLVAVVLDQGLSGRVLPEPQGQFRGRVPRNLDEIRICPLRV